MAEERATVSQAKLVLPKAKSLQSLLLSLPVEDQSATVADTLSVETFAYAGEFPTKSADEQENELPGTSVVLYADSMVLPNNSPHAIESLAAPHEDPTPEIDNTTQNILPLLDRAASADRIEMTPQLIDAEQLSRKLEGRRQSSDSLLRTLNAHEQQTNRDRRAFNAKVAEVEQLRLSNEELRSELERVNIAKEQLEIKLLDVSSLHSELQSSRIDCNRTRMDLNRLKVDYDAASGEIASLREEVVRRGREADLMSVTYEQRLKEMESDRRRNFDQIKALQSELSDKSSFNNKITEELMATERRLAQCETENSALRRRVAELESVERECASLRRQVSSLETDMNLLSVEHARSSSRSSYDGTSNAVDATSAAYRRQQQTMNDYDISASSRRSSYGYPASYSTSEESSSRPSSTRSRPSSLQTDWGSSHVDGGDAELLPPPPPAYPPDNPEITAGERERDLRQQRGVGARSSATSTGGNERNSSGGGGGGDANNQQGFSGRAPVKSLAELIGGGGGGGNSNQGGGRGGSDHSSSSISNSANSNAFPPPPSSTRSAASLAGNSASTAYDPVQARNNHLSSAQYASGYTAASSSPQNSASNGGGGEYFSFQPQQQKSSRMSTGSIGMNNNLNNNNNNSNSNINSGSGSSRGGGAAGDRAPAFSTRAPFGTDETAVAVNVAFYDLERRLTSLMTEKATLDDESQKLSQRGAKTLRDRTRVQQIDLRMAEISREISSTRKTLSGKPN